MSLEERFWNKVNCGEEDECWEWQGATDSDGYGKIRDNGPQIGAHRASWKIHCGDPDEFHVLHECDNRLCVNPDHLYLGDHSENMEDMWTRNRDKRPTGEDAHATVLTQEEVGKIRSRLGDDTHSSIADDFDVSSSTISMIATGENWGDERYR